MVNIRGGALIDIIIPAHNEQATVGKIVEACLGAYLGDVIVVADACTDATVAAASAATRVVQIDARNKGSAMSVGLGYVTAETVLFVDGDLLGLLPSHLEALSKAAPLAGQVVGVTESVVNRWTRFGFPPITGQRRLPTDFARRVPMAGQGYKVELVIDAWCGKENLPHEAYVLRGVTNPTRVYEDPVGWSAMWADLGVASIKYLPDLVKYTVT